MMGEKAIPHGMVRPLRTFKANSFGEVGMVNVSGDNPGELRAPAAFPAKMPTLTIETITGFDLQAAPRRGIVGSVSTKPQGS